MDITAFTEFKTGILVPIETGSGANHAFIPNKLTASLDLDQKLWQLVADARGAVERLEQIKGILPDPLFLLHPLQQREALHSSRLEGTHATPGELLLFDVQQEGDEAIKIPADARASDQLEVWNHYDALRQGSNWLQEGRRLDRSLILDLHRILMTGVRGKDKTPGSFRECQVFVGRRPRSFIPPPCEQIEDCIESLVSFMHSNVEMDPLVKAFVVHYQFEAIHPFQDGNGRVGRLLLSLCVSEWMNLTHPWLYISEYFEKHRKDYNEHLYRISTNGEWEEWLEFCLVGAIEQSQSALRRCEKLRKLREYYIEEFGNLGKRIRGIIDMLFERSVVTAPQIAKRFGVSTVTARLDIRKLVEANVLSPWAGKPRPYLCPEILKAAYGDSGLK